MVLKREEGTDSEQIITDPGSIEVTDPISCRGEKKLTQKGMLSTKTGLLSCRGKLIIRRSL